MALKLKLDESDYLREATVFGLCSDLPDHRLCYFLNLDLNLNLARLNKDHQVVIKNQEHFFAEYTYCDSHGRYWHLNANNSGYFYNEEEQAQQSSSSSCVNDLRVFDYFLWYEESGNTDLDAEIKLRLKQLSYVRTSQLIDQSSSKNINNLLIEY